MPKYLSQEWLDQVKELAADQAEHPGISGQVQCVVTGTSEGEVAYVQVIEDGKLLESTRGRLSDPEITFTCPYDDAVRMQRGELDPNVAYMQGKLKVTGDLTKFLQLLPLTSSPDFVALQAKIRQVTEY
jgi:putative sterol carrier protein